MPLWRKGTESDVETMVKVETAKVGGNAFAVKEKIFVFHGTVVQDGWFTCYVSRVRVWKWTWRWAGLPRIVFDGYGP